MRLLLIDAALARGFAAVWAEDRALAIRRLPPERGQAVRLPRLVEEVLEAAGTPIAALDGAAVTVGPGSFTGLRAALALAQGLALAAGLPLIGVTVPEALEAALPPMPGRTVWTVIGTGRRGRIFLAEEGAIRAVMWDALPMPDGPIALAGDAAPEAAAWLAARGADVLLTDARFPCPPGVAEAARRRIAGLLPALTAQPLYVDAPEVRAPAVAPRPAPAEHY